MRTLEDGLHTRDIAPEQTRQVLGTQEFADAVIERLGQHPAYLKPVPTPREAAEPPRPRPRAPIVKQLVGTDVFFEWAEGERDPEALAAVLQSAQLERLPLLTITNRGVKVWPQGLPETFKSDHWRCRFLSDGSITYADVLALLSNLN